MMSDFQKRSSGEPSNCGEVAKSLEHLVQDIQKCASPADFMQLSAGLSELFQAADEDQKVCLPTRAGTNAYIDIFDALVENSQFVDAVTGWIQQRQSILDEAEGAEWEWTKTRKALSESAPLQKRIIFAAVQTTTIPLVYLMPNISQDTARYLRRRLSAAIFRLREVVAPQEPVDVIANLLIQVAGDSNLVTEVRWQAKIDGDVHLKRCWTASSVFSVMLGLLYEIRYIGRIAENFSNRDESESSMSPISALNKVAKKLYGVNNLWASALEVDNTVSSDVDRFFSAFISQSNQKHLREIISIFVESFVATYDTNYAEDFLSDSNKILEKLDIYARENLAAFADDQRPGLEGGREWANKIYITTRKTIAGMSSARDAKDIDWLYSVFTREAAVWFFELYQIIHLSRLEDDWEDIAPYTKREDEFVEWKSSFFTKIQITEPKEEGVAKKQARETLGEIVRAMLGIMNTKGGWILVGLVEHQDRIRRVSVKNSLVEKHGYHFFDLGVEMERFGKDLDQIRGEILANLCEMTQLSPDRFNGAFALRQLVIRDERVEGREREAKIVLITVRKASNAICVHKENFISMYRRANGRTDLVDPTEYLVSGENRPLEWTEPRSDSV